MEILGLPQWTLSARLEGDVLEFSLGDGRRLVWRSRRPSNLLDQATGAMPAADLLGADLADRLAQSAPRVLNVQFEEPLDGVAWEMLSLGAATMAEQFALGRQLVSGMEAAPIPAPTLADALAVVVIGDAVATYPDTRRIPIDALGESWARDCVSTAHVIVVNGLELSHVIEQSGLPERGCLLVLRWPQPVRHLSAALDAGAAVLALGRERDFDSEKLDALLLQLGSGASIGEAVRWLHRHEAPARFDARLYGDPGMRFVRVQAPASRRQVTSLSFDLVGSTTLLQRLGDEAYADVLASLHARCTDVVHRHGGQSRPPQGNDGVMCYFGHPAAVEDAPVHALKAGLEIVRTVADLGVSVRVGIATGLVAIKDSVPVGLSIHLAARLQQVTEPGTVLISNSTRHLVAHAFDTRKLEPPPVLKGIDDEKDCYLVIGPSRDAKAHRLERMSWLTPLVGRQAELAHLDTCWRQARAGGTLLAVVRGDAGMGKSRLVREFRHELVQAGVKVLECRCRADASASPYLTLAEALRRWLDIGADADPGALHKLAAALPERSRESEPLGLMAALLGLAPQPPHSSRSGLRHRQLSLLLEWFGTLAKGRPCCLIVEDWHWVDPSMGEFVEHLVERQDGPGLLVVITMRAEAGQPRLAFGRYEQIELAGLPPEAARELVGLVGASAPLPAGLVRMLAARGDGVPLFLEEATRMALELGVDRLGADVTALETVPASLQDLLMARLDGLGTAKHVAQVAAVVGREFSLDLLTALLETGVLALDSLALGEGLAVLVASGLVRSLGEGRYAFKHALIRDAAYASLWVRDRHALHARVVVLLQERWPELSAMRPELLALHQTEAGLNREALTQWELAASNAAARSAELEAISHLHRALAVLARIEPGLERDRTALRLQLLLAARLIATEGYGADAVLQAYLEAQRLCDRIGDDDTARFKVEMGLEAYRFMRADFGPALEHGRRAAAIAARSGDTKQRLHAHWGLACTLFHQGALRATMREMESGLALYTPALHSHFGVQDPGVMCMAYSSWGLWELGQPDSALARINQAARMAAEFEHKFSQAVALAYGTSIELLRGETDAALARADACIHVCDEAGFPVWLAITRCMRGRLLCEQGAFEVGLREMRAGYAQWLSTGAMVSRPLYLALQAEGLMLAGQWEGAAACVDEGLAIVDRYGERQLEAEMRRLRGELALQRGDTGEAEAWLKGAYALAIRQHRLGFALRSATSLARLWATGGHHDRSRRLLVPLVARWSEGRTTRDVRAALALCEALQ